MTLLDSADTEHSHHCRKFYWTLQKRVCYMPLGPNLLRSMLATLTHEDIRNSSNKQISNASQLHRLFQSLKIFSIGRYPKKKREEPGSPIQSPATGLENLGIPLMRFGDLLNNTCRVHFLGLHYELLSDPSILFGQVLFHLPVCLSIFLY